VSPEQIGFISEIQYEKQEKNLTDVADSSSSYSEDENMEKNDPVTEQDDDPDDSDKEDNKDYASSYPPVNCLEGEVSIRVKKAERRLELWKGDTLIGSYSIGLGRNPEGHKQREGDGRTPEGEYYVCVKNYNSSFYLSLGVSYPNKVDAAAALEDGRIDRTDYNRIVDAIDKGQQPDWYTSLGGEIMIHGHGGSRDWTAGCIAVDNEVMDILFEYCSVGTRITILP